jgi:2-polyprenyl-3-methyl-5-hydroxy-6-metoxy-1,4-benzoquinol methylase
VDEDQARARKQEIIDRFGNWFAYNVHLLGDLYTIGRGKIGVGEENIARALQLVADNAPKPLDQLRILDLGAHEGGFAIEFARHGAEVVAIEAREAHVQKARFVKECLGLEKLEIVQDDVRNLSADRHGSFDIVLCLGILYHLDAPDIVPFVSAVSAVCRDLILLETQISLRATDWTGTGAQTYAGGFFPEDPSQPGAAIEGRRSFWLTKSSLLNLLADVGFTSVTESRSPPVLFTAPVLDHVTFLARKGSPVRMLSLPESERPTLQRWPERMKRHPSPSQSRVLSFRDRLARLTGRGFHQRLRRKGGK